jgi:uncharacterized surface protein with fasciclin (FAS1) repeats
MKHLNSILSKALIFILFSSAFLSCKKDETPAISGKTIADVVSSDPNFSLLKLAVEKTGLGKYLTETEDLTVFAPDNEAFKASGITEATINSLPKTSLDSILKYHILKGKFVSSSLSGQSSVQTLLKIEAFPTKNNNEYFINSSKLKTIDLLVKNGVIHVVSGVLTAPTTISEYVAVNPNLSILKSAVIRANLLEALSGGSFTVFAPDNNAFTGSGITESVINSLSPSAVDSILKYHVLGKKVPSNGVPASDSVRTLVGTNIYVSRNVNGVFVNGINVKTADLNFKNGIVHVISKVLTAPTKNIAEIVIGDGELSLLLAAVIKSGLAGTVSGAGKFTVFAPTDSAFIKAGYANVSAINAASAEAVAAIVRAHILQTNVFSSDLISGAIVPTLETNKSLEVGLVPPSVKIVGSEEPASNIIISGGVNIIATNGVIHKIDRLLE